MTNSTRLSPVRTAPGSRLEAVALVWWLAAATIALVDLLREGTLGSAVVQPQALNHGMLLGLPAQHLSVGLVVYSAAGAAIAGWMWASRRRHGAIGRVGRAILVAVVVTVLLGALVLVDATLLAALGYLPAVVLLAPFDAEIRASLALYAEPDLLLQVVAVIGVVLLVVVAVRSIRSARDACERCGRPHDGDEPGWTTTTAAARWGRTAALVAAAMPAVYGLTRIAWAFGISLGYDEEFSGDDLIAPLGLGGFALVGAVLTLGLYQGWGEVFPRWIPGLAGRRVPVMLAVVPAGAVAALILPAGVAVIGMGMRSGLLGIDAAMLVAVGPAVLWPLWSIALGAATYGYWLRRRGTCRVCGRGQQADDSA